MFHSSSERQFSPSASLNNSADSRAFISCCADMLRDAKHSRRGPSLETGLGSTPLNARRDYLPGACPLCSLFHPTCWRSTDHRCCSIV
jgi:hypothetical protein